jgi:hypothetical protein
MNESQVRAVELLAQEYDYGRGTLHAHKVADLAKSLFDQLQVHNLLRGMQPGDRCTLCAAAYAHDIGLSPRAMAEVSSLAHSIERGKGMLRHHEAGFRVLRCRLGTPGFGSAAQLSGEDRAMLLYSILWHEGATTFALDAEPLVNREKVFLLTGILRLADGLDCRTRLRVREVRLQRASAWLRVLVRGISSVTDEITQARIKSDMLGQALGIRVFVQEIIEE